MSRSESRAWLAAAALLLAGGFVLAPRSLAQQPGQRTFSSPAAAASALFAAIHSNDERAILAILGPDGRRIVSSGDAEEDAADRANFVHRYDEMHRLAQEPDGTLTLYVGAENWPMPIPIARSGHAWYFDTAAGRREILYRRIGRNEISAIRVLEELVAAQKEYRSTHDEFAERIYSRPGLHDGLYWQQVAGEPESPIGPLVASAVAAGYPGPHSGTRTPFRGYYYHTLKRQGAHAPGGAQSYLAGGKMTGGFAFVAYPAQYRSSGVMTFIVGEDGVVYQKDLGRMTEVLAKALQSYDPGPSWRRSEEESPVSSAR
jgi:hypothetical protein